jgi:hypothetical protein
MEQTGIQEILKDLVPHSHMDEKLNELVFNIVGD